MPDMDAGDPSRLSARSPQRQRASTLTANPLPRRSSIISSPSIGIRRLPSYTSVHSTRSREERSPSPRPTDSHASVTGSDSIDFAPRRRSSSEPRPMAPSHHLDTLASPISTRNDPLNSAHMPTLAEEGRHSSSISRFNETENGFSIRVPQQQEPAELSPELPAAESSTQPLARRQSMINRAREGLGNMLPGRGARPRSDTYTSDEVEYDSDLVNLLDVIDPEVSTLSTLTNVQNSLFVPDLGRLINRRPAYNLTAISPRQAKIETDADKVKADKDKEDALQDKVDQQAEAGVEPYDDDLVTITSNLSDSRYAVLPHGVSLDGWTVEQKEQLDDHVRHMLHSKRAAFHRSMKGFRQYVRRPLGFFITLYATLITLFGFAWVLFLIGWVNLGARRYYIINVIDNVLVALFAIMGDGLIPFRLIDTYHMAYIAHYHHLTWSIRKKMKLPTLPNHNDLPNRTHPIAARGASIDLEALRPTSTHDSENPGNPEYYSVLSEEQQRKLEHHQAKFMKSHTFYKPHETETHFAFPLRLLVAIVTILDFHSVFQVTLGSCTWAIPYKKRPFSLTTVILCISITCNITGGVLIMIGDRRTRKKEVRERMFRQQLTEEAIKRLQRDRFKEQGLASVPEVHDERADEERAKEQELRAAAHLPAVTIK